MNRFVFGESFGPLHRGINRARFAKRLPHPSIGQFVWRVGIRHCEERFLRRSRVRVQFARWGLLRFARNDTGARLLSANCLLLTSSHCHSPTARRVRSTHQAQSPIASLLRSPNPLARVNCPRHPANRLSAKKYPGCRRGRQSVRA